MKKLLATVCVLGSGLMLSACAVGDDFDKVDYEVPYAQERTAGGHTHHVMKKEPMKEKKAERMFKKKMAK